METRTGIRELQELFVEEIDFINRDNISISGIMRSGPGLIRAQFITDAEVLKRILNHSGKTGHRLMEQLIPIMERKQLSGKVNAPLELSARPVCLQGCILQISRGRFVDESGKLVEDEENMVFYIDQAIPKNPIPMRIIRKRRRPASY